MDGLEPSPRCPCGKEVSCTWHMLCECPLTEDLRANYQDEDMFVLSRRQHWNPLYSRGVPARPRMPPPPDDISRDFGDQTFPRLASGDAYTDGAMRGRCRQVLRAGWAFAIVDQSGAVVWGRYGSLAERYPSVLRAELRGLLEILRCAADSLTVHVDNAEVVRGMQMGHKWCRQARREGADLWDQVWALAEPMGRRLSVVKVKAHLTDEALSRGLISRRDLLGNRAADELAKRGAVLAALSSPTSEIEMAFRQAVRWTKWVVSFAANWPPPFGSRDYEPDDRADRASSAADAPNEPGCLPPEAASGRGRARGAAAALRARARAAALGAAAANRQESAPWRLHHQRPHALWVSATTAVCRRCGRSTNATAGKHRRAFARTACPGAAAGRALARLGVDQSALDARCRLSRVVLHDRGLVPAAGNDGSDDDIVATVGASTHAAASTADPPHVHDADAPPPGKRSKRDVPAALGDASRVGRGEEGGPPLDSSHARSSPAGDRTEGADEPTDLAGAPSPSILAVSGKRPAQAAMLEISSTDSLVRDPKRPRVPQSASSDTAAAEPQPEPSPVPHEPGSSAASRTAPGTPAVSAAVEAAPAWLPSARWGTNHRISIFGPIACCTVCGRYAIERVGRGLLDPCTGPDADARVRVHRMRQGRHPITGQSLTDR